MKLQYFNSSRLFALATAVLLSMGLTTASATEPCDPGFGECKVLVEINSTDGDIGFHFLMDGDNLIRAALYNPYWRKIFSYYTRRELREQTLTETFAESAEPLCFDPTMDDDEENDDEEFRTLAEFVDLWKPGTYHFVGISNEWEWSFGHTTLSFNLPAAPTDLAFELEEEEPGSGEFEGEISWAPGEDLGECWDGEEELPYGVNILDNDDVVAWEIVLEPEFEDDDPLAAQSLKYVVRVGTEDLELEDGVYEMEVPDDYLETLPDDTKIKIEIGAIGPDDNATFTEIDEDENEEPFCINEVEGCDD